LGDWAKDNYPNSKSDLFAMFIERGLEIVPRLGYSAMVTMQSWMFLSSFEAIRSKLMSQTSIEAMAHMGNMVMGIAFGTSATVWKIGGDLRLKGAYCYVEYEDIGEGNKPKVFPPRNQRNKGAAGHGWFYRASAGDFNKIPGSPIAYWFSEKVYKIFDQNDTVDNYAAPKQGLATGDNSRFLRGWHEVSVKKIGFAIDSCTETSEVETRWFPYNKGGEFRKWYGNIEFLVNWQNNGYEIRSFVDDYGKVRSRAQNTDYYFKPSVSWSKVTIGGFSLRYFPKGFIFDVAGCSLITDDQDVLKIILGSMNSPIMTKLYSSLMPTVNYEVGQIAKFPYLHAPRATAVVQDLIDISKVDWASYETSWDFTNLPLLNPDHRQSTLTATYQQFRLHCQEMTQEMQRLEEENNRIFIDAYGLQDELTPDVPLEKITLTCNPHYRYGGERTADELEAQLLADTMRELVSYAVGCMFGRYALEVPGLVLANQGETLEDYMARVPNPTFPADSDNVIPILDDEWFTDDIVSRFKEFLKLTFGTAEFEANLRFVESALNVKGKRNYTIRHYFTGEFYADHVKRYKKRPIYWMFSSPKGSFNALIYIHRYRPETVGVVLNGYLREFRSKLMAEKQRQEAVSITGSPAEKTDALKELDRLGKMLHEIDDYEREVLYPLATQRISIDLDDGVKTNYPKFGVALKKIPGLETTDD
jgi:hypothetical protein